ncbi:MAG: FG-GAP-like repeat-containing protein [Candidatus Aenigmatarchaeota archaeon]
MKNKKPWDDNGVAFAGLILLAIIFLDLIAFTPIGKFELQPQEEMSIDVQSIPMKTHAPQKFFGSEPTGMSVNKSDAEKVSRDFLSKKKATFGIDDKALVLSSVEEQPKQKTYFVNFDQTYKGVPVYGGRVTLYMKNAKIAYVKSNYYQNINVPTVPKVSEQAASDIVKNNLISHEHEIPEALNPIGHQGIATGIVALQGYYDITGKFREYSFSKVPSIKESKLVVYPLKGKYYLARKIRAQSDNYDITFFVDTDSGKIVDAKDNRIYYDVFGTVTGKEWEDPFTDGKQMTKPFVHNYVYVSIGSQQQETDDTGDYTFAGITGTNTLKSYLEGPWVKVFNDQLDESYHFATIKTPKKLVSDGINTGLPHSWSWASNDNSYLDEESNAFYHVNRIHDYAVSVGVGEMDFQMTTNVNIDATCNAYYDGSSINFFKKGSGCEDTALLSDVIYHEYGHGIIDRLDPSVSSAGYWGEPGNIHEALSDYWACTLNDNPNQGEGFYAGNPTPLRTCNSNDRYPENYNPEPHSGAQIISGAMWDIREALGKQYLDPLLVNALRLQPITFSELVEALLVADDDNANLADGTPNIETICNNFYTGHGILSLFCIGYTEHPIAFITPLKEFYLDGIVNITGYAISGNKYEFKNYTIAYSSGNEWKTEGIELVNGGFSEVYGDVLATLNTSYVNEGFHMLKLTVTDSGNRTTHSIYFVIDRSLHQGFPAEINSTLQDDVLSFVVADIDNDSFKEIVLKGLHKTFVYRHDGTKMTGWPRSMGGYVGTTAYHLSPPSIADINHDGKKEIFVEWPQAPGYVDDEGNPMNYCLYGWHYNGVPLEGFPLNCSEQFDYASYYIPPVISDINGDGSLEIILIIYGFDEKLHKVFVWNNNGTLLEHWPFVFNQGNYYINDLASGDVDGDGKNDIIFQVNNFDYFILNANATILHQFSFEDLPGRISLADLNNDNKSEIIMKGLAVAWVFDANGTLLWKQYYRSWNVEGAAIGKIDTDNIPEIVFGSSTVNGYQGETYIVHSNNGTLLNSWEIVPSDRDFKGNEQENLIADINMDGKNEIIANIWNNNNPSLAFSEIHAWNADGSELYGFPKIVPGKANTAPAVDDIDSDGKLELITLSFDDKIYVWDLNASYDQSQMEWPMYRHDEQHTGNYNYRQELTKNPSLEVDNGIDYYPMWSGDDATANNNFPDGWGYGAVPAEKRVLDINGKIGKAIRLTGDTNQNYIIQDIPVEFGKKYEVGGWIKSELTGGTGKGMILSQCVDTSHNLDWGADCGLRVDPMIYLRGTTDWTYVNFTVNANKANRMLRVACINDANNIGNIWCDEFSVRQVP